MIYIRSKTVLLKKKLSKQNMKKSNQTHKDTNGRKRISSIIWIHMEWNKACGCDGKSRKCHNNYKMNIHIEI